MQKGIEIDNHKGHEGTRRYTKKARKLIVLKQLSCCLTSFAVFASAARPRHSDLCIL